MDPLKYIIIIFLTGLCLVSQSRGQDAYLAGAAEFLAAQCGTSSGQPAENYLEYGRKLAKTISALTPEQQARVFGSELGSYHDAANKAGKTNASGGGSDSQTVLSEEETPTLTDRLKEWLGL